MLYLILISLPIIGLFLNLISKNIAIGAKFATISVWGSFLVTIFAWVSGHGQMEDSLSWIIATLILFVSAIIHSFSIRYMAGDSNYRKFFMLLTLITISSILLAFADDMRIFFISWIAGNLLLVMLMIHKEKWEAARQSGILALKIFTIGGCALAFAMVGLFVETGKLSLDIALSHPDISGFILVLVIIAAMTQSAQFPFHKWLISSLNSPTPVSALMHAGLVNGGGILLVKFSPLFIENTILLNLLFVIGFVTMIIGVFWSLIQSDVKKMLACSTKAQMGFMVMQCGLGLFPAAIAHLCWHGLFKAYMFLGAGSAVAEKNAIAKNTDLKSLLISLIFGAIGAYGFLIASEKELSANSNLFLLGFAFIATAQLSINSVGVAKLIAPFAAGIIYGLSVGMIEAVLPTSLNIIQDLNILHISCFALIFMLWIFGNMVNLKEYQMPKWMMKLYVVALNSSQPEAKTITMIRNNYKY